MRKKLVVIGLVLVSGGGVLGWLFLQNRPVSAPTPPPSANTSKKTVNPKEHSYTDADFAKKMIVHNQQGMQMADIAKERAVSQEVRQVAATISKELSAETQQYINWLTGWKETYFNLSDFPEMDGHDMYPTHPGMASLGDLEKLKAASGYSVDEQFLSLMIKHHEGADEMANSIAFKEMQFGQMIDLKTRTLRRQAEELQTMKQLQVKGE